MKRDMKETSKEMSTIQKTLQETSLPQMKQQMESVSQELQEFRDLKRNLSNPQFQHQAIQPVSAPVNYAPQAHQPQMFQHGHPTLQHHQWGGQG